ncbi:hypothetical protein HAX54_009553 [Datura stramonium]|uniref:Uncharacterized protein n=1 Tax=Datura stramonium TaxID=4076 RepID=A0ABS8RWA5_DATST|nr:hypothetical protein [Datura stramonium]
MGEYCLCRVKESKSLSQLFLTRYGIFDLFPFFISFGADLYLQVDNRSNASTKNFYLVAQIEAEPLNMKREELQPKCLTIFPKQLKIFIFTSFSSNPKG